MEELVYGKEPCCPFFAGEKRSDRLCTGKPGSRIEVSVMQEYCCDIDGWRRCSLARELMLKEEAEDEMDAEERGKWKAKVDALTRTNRELRKRLEDTDTGMKQISRSVDSIMAVACVQFGESVGDDQWELTLPGVNVLETLKRYSVVARRDPLHDNYVIRCTRKKA